MIVKIPMLRSQSSDERFFMLRGSGHNPERMLRFFSALSPDEDWVYEEQEIEVTEELVKRLMRLLQGLM